MLTPTQARVARVIAFIGLLIIVCQIAQAQGTFDIVVDGDLSEALAFSWSTDNQYLVFVNNDIVPSSVNINVTLSEPAWQQFNVATQVLSTGMTNWPLQPNLTAAEQAAFEPIDFILSSPDNQLLAFGVSGIGHVAFGNRVTLQRHETEILARYPDFVGASAFWSADSSAFVYNRGAALMPGPLLYHVRVPNPADLSSIVVISFADVIIGDHIYIMSGEMENEDRLFDVSADGSRVLLSARKIPQDPLLTPQFSELIVWHPENSASNTIIELFDVQRICNASFAPNNDQQIVILLSDGQLMAYNLETNTATRLSTTLAPLPDCLETAPTVDTVFSHNGHWLAIINKTTGQLAFVDISRLLAEPPTTILQPPVAVAGPDLLVYDVDSDGGERVVLDASGSFDPDGTITDYVWSQGQIVMRLAADQTVGVGLGENRITLTVIDDDNLVGRDEIMIVVEPLSIVCTTMVLDTPTLLSAIASANTTPEADTICLESGTYTLTTSNNSASDGANGLPVITSDITLHGLGAGATILRDSAAPAFRILKVDTGARLVLENITVSGGDAGSGSGGGIRNLGTLELRNSVVENNLPDDLSGVSLG